jgi:hypothetical protein
VFVALVGSLCLTSSPAWAHDQSYIFLWAHGLTTPRYQPTANYLYNDAGTSIEITRIAMGEYSVMLPALSQVTTTWSHAQVEAYGPGGGHYCKIAATGSPLDTVTVHCYDASGVKADQQFTLLVLLPDVHDSPFVGVDLFLPYAFARTNQPSTPAYTVTTDVYNAGSTDPIDVVRRGPGDYEVTWTNFGSVGTGGGNVQVSAFGPGNEQCYVQSWGNSTAFVRCFDPSGAPVDAEFNVLFWRPEATDPGIAFAWADNPSSPSYTPSPSYSYNAAGGALIAERTGVGNYRMNFADLDPTETSFGHVQVSAYGTSDVRCRTGGWVSATGPTSTFVDVDCADSTGAPIDTRYSVLFLWPPKKALDQTFAFTRNHFPASASDDVTLDEETFNRAGGTVLITSTTTGRYLVDFEGFENFAGGGNVQVTAESTYGESGRYCNIESWAPGAVAINCYDAAGVAADSLFSVFFIKKPPGETAAAYAWADQPSSASYTPSFFYSENPGGGAVTAHRSATGAYQMTFSGFGLLGVGGGHPQVTPYGSGNNARCTVLSWFGDTVYVRCFDSAGSPADSSYALLYFRPDTVHDALAFAWSDDGSFPSAYEPNPFYSFNSGDGLIAITSIHEGLYGASFVDFERQGIGPGNVQLTAYSGTDVNCAILGSDDRSAEAECVDSAGLPTTTALNALIIKPVVAPEPEIWLQLAAGMGLLGALHWARRRRLLERGFLV